MHVAVFPVVAQLAQPVEVVLRRHLLLYEGRQNVTGVYVQHNQSLQQHSYRDRMLVAPRYRRPTTWGRVSRARVSVKSFSDKTLCSMRVARRLYGLHVQHDQSL